MITWLGRYHFAGPAGIAFAFMSEPRGLRASWDRLQAHRAADDSGAAAGAGAVLAPESQLLADVVDKLTGLGSQLRQTLTDHAWASIPFPIVEHAYAASQPADTPLIVTHAVASLVKITSVIVCVPANGTAVVQLGEIRIPVGTGVTVLAPLELPLQSGALRSVVSNTQGPVAMLLTGVQLPTFGVVK